MQDRTGGAPGVLGPTGDSPHRKPRFILEGRREPREHFQQGDDMVGAMVEKDLWAAAWRMDLSGTGRIQETRRGTCEKEAVMCLISLWLQSSAHKGSFLPQRREVA